MISLNVNGKGYNVNVDGATPLLWTLRDVLGLTGTKYGCGIEVCGACTVLVDGQPERACVYDTSSRGGTPRRHHRRTLAGSQSSRTARVDRQGRSLNAGTASPE